MSLLPLRPPHRLLALLCAALVTVATQAQPDAPAAAPRTYTTDAPLVYEDVQELWPYSFLNENGQPDGFNIELIHLILDQLQLPYVIRLKPTQAAYNDMRDGRSDLMMGLAVGFHDAYGHYGQNSVTLFTQSVLSPKSRPTEVHNFRDLATHRVYVCDSSLCHHLMIDYGWAANAMPVDNIQELILRMSTEEQGELVWNTLSLKWLLQKYQIDNLEITPVNMPHGEYKFISNDPLLLHRVDSVYTELSSSERLTPLLNRWFYPERQEEVTPQWVWYVGGGTALLLVLLLFYTLSYRHQARRITRENQRRNRRLALILETSGVRVWTYDIEQRMFTWRNEFGQPAYVYTPDEFATRYSADDYVRLTEVMERLRTIQPNADGSEPEVTLDIRAKDAREDGDTEMHDFVIALSVLRRDRHGQPTVLIGTKKDVTDKRRQQRLDDERTLRYWSLFNTPMAGIMLFAPDGRLQNINPKACEMMGASHDDLVARGATMSELLHTPDTLDIAGCDGYHASVVLPAGEDAAAAVTPLSSGVCRLEFRLLTVTDDGGDLLGVFAVCQDVTHVVRSLDGLRAAHQRLDKVRHQEQQYVTTINGFVRDANIRLVSYSPDTHLLSIISANDRVDHTLTQTRIMTLVEDRQRKRIMHLVDKMDSREHFDVETDVATSLRVHGLTVHVYIHMLPQTTADGSVREYLGIMRDISRLKDAEHQLAAVKAQTQEVEETKNAFVRNMMHEIQTPMQTVISRANELAPAMTHEAEEPVTQAIIENADLLTHIIGNVLDLSRIEAHMVEMVRRPADLAQLFGSWCQNGWGKHHHDGVRYIAESPYEQLVADVDADHLGTVVQQVVLNAAQHTTAGTIRARYDYIGRRLMVSVEDTGEGMTPEQLASLNSQLQQGTHFSSGLGLPICRALLAQMGGTLEIASEQGVGTTVWVSLPCIATTVKRKKILETA